MGKVERLKVFNPDQPVIHPSADIFPMMDDEALEDLAADIKAKGLLVPIVVDNDGQLIDGRNRLMACKMAGVEPTIQRYEGKDPVAFILSTNITRRHLTKGQQAMATAVLYPEPEKGGRGKKLSGDLTVSRERISKARIVLSDGRELKDQVLSGGLSLDAAYEEAKRRKEAAGTAEGQMERLRRDGADLVELVVEERMTLDEAIGALDAREREEKRQIEVRKGQRRNATNQLHGVLMQLFPHGHDENLDAAHNKAVSWLKEIDMEYWPSGTGVVLTAETIAACAATLTEIGAALKREASDE